MISHLKKGSSYSLSVFIFPLRNFVVPELSASVCEGGFPTPTSSSLTRVECLTIQLYSALSTQRQHQIPQD